METTTRTGTHKKERTQQPDPGVVTYGLLLALAASLLLNIFQLTEYNRQNTFLAGRVGAPPATENSLRTELARYRRRLAQQDRLIQTLNHAVSTSDAGKNNGKNPSIARN